MPYGVSHLNRFHRAVFLCLKLLWWESNPRPKESTTDLHNNQLDGCVPHRVTPNSKAHVVAPPNRHSGGDCYNGCQKIVALHIRPIYLLASLHTVTNKPRPCSCAMSVPTRLSHTSKIIIIATHQQANGNS